MLHRSVPIVLAFALLAGAGPANAQTGVPRYAKLPLSFEANAGQAAKEVKFLSRAPGYVLFLTEREAVVAPAGGAPLRMRWIGANPHPAISGAAELAARSHYYRGQNGRLWQASAPHYREVRYSNVYRGVDLVYYGTAEGRVEYDFVVAPGADPAAIDLQFDGAAKLDVNSEGDLVIALEGPSQRTVILHKPVIYQEAGHGRRAVPGAYVVRGRRVGFEIGPYDSKRPLTIDPVLTLSYSTFLGGGASDKAMALAVDGQGRAVVTGNTSSINFPTANAAQPTAPGGDEHFVAKLSADGSSLVYATYLGGTLGEGTNQGALALDASGNTYVVGSTQSADFPTTPGAYQTALKNPDQGFGSFDGYIVKLTPAGALVYSSLLGGSFFDGVYAVDVDAAGNAYVTGTTQSSDFPLVGAIKSARDDSFVAKLNPTGSGLVYSTYFGGNQFDVPTAIVADESGSAYLTGITASSDFPAVNAVQGTMNGSECSPGRPCGDAFLTKINAGGTAFVYSTFLGGSGKDRGTDIEVDAFGSVYVVGDTTSGDFPVTAGALQSTNAGAEDVFIAKFDATGSSLAYSTYLGGSKREGTGFINEHIVGISLAVDPAGDMYLAGVTASADFPAVNPMQGFVAGGPSHFQAFLTKLNATGTALTYSTAINPPQEMSGEVDVAIDLLGNAYLAGGVSGPAMFGGYPTTPNALQPAHAGGHLDAFVARVSHFVTVPIDIKPDSHPNTINLGSSGVVNVAILSTATFDATTVDPLTVTLASAPVKLKGNGTPQVVFRDVNGDGRQDIVVQIETEALQLNANDTTAVLEAETLGGTAIVGTDLVRIVP